MKKYILVSLFFVFLFQASALTQISSCQGLEDIDNDLTANYELSSDVDCSGYGPINITGTFSGNFDGNFYEIQNANLTYNDTSIPPSFFEKADGSIGNFTFRNGYTHGYSGRTSFIVNDLEGGTVENIAIKGGNITGTLGDSGLAVGFADSSPMINNVTVEGDYNASISGSAHFGSIVGYALSGEIYNSGFKGNLDLNGGDNVGGLMGQSEMVAENITFKGNLTSEGASIVGGVAGWFQGSNIHNLNMNFGTIESDTYLFGISTIQTPNYEFNASDISIVGEKLYSSSNYVAGGGEIDEGHNISRMYVNINNISSPSSASALYENGHSSSTINNSYAATNTQVSPNEYVDFNNVYASTEDYDSGNHPDVTYLNGTEMRQESSYNGFDFTNYWEFVTGRNEGYPVLQYLNLDPKDVNPPEVAFASNSSTGLTNTSSVLVNSSVEDSLSSVDQVKIVLDGANYSVSKQNGYYSKEFTGLSDGTHTYKIFSEDTKGNSGYSTEKTVDIDTVNPAVYNVSAEKFDYHSVNLSLTQNESLDNFTASFAGNTYYKQDFNKYGDSYYKELTPSEGTYTFSFSSLIDLAGNKINPDNNSTVEAVNNAPFVDSVDPSDGKIGVNDSATDGLVDADLNAVVEDSDGQNISGDIYFNGSFETSFSNVSSGSTVSTTVQDLNYTTEYSWYVTTSDGDKDTVSSTYTFTTTANGSTIRTPYDIVQDTSQSSTSDTVYLSQKMNYLNDGNENLTNYLVTPPDIPGNCSDCEQSIDLDVNNDKNLTFHSSGDFITNEAASGLTMAQNMVRYGAFSNQYSTSQTVDADNSLQNTGLSFDISPSIPNTQGCSVDNDTVVNIPSNSGKSFLFEKTCTPGQEISTSVSNKSLQNSTQYNFTADTEIYTDLTSEVPHEYWVPVSEFPDWGGRNESNISVSVDNNPDNVSVDTRSKDGSDYVVVTTGTQHTNSSIHVGSHTTSVIYEVSDSYSSGGGSGGGGLPPSGGSGSGLDLSFSGSFSDNESRLSVPTGSSRTTKFVIKNGGSETITVDMECSVVNEAELEMAAALCDGVEFEQESITVAPGEEKSVSVNVALPEDFDEDSTAELKLSASSSSGESSQLLLEVSPGIGLPVPLGLVPLLVGAVLAGVAWYLRRSGGRRFF